MSSAVSQKYLEFGKCKLPLDTATSFSVSQGWLFGIFSYEVSIYFRTKKGEASHFTLKSIETLEKVRGLIQQLRHLGVHWVTWATQIIVSPKNHTIDLIYPSYSWAGTSVDKKELRWGDVYMLFQETLGLPKAKNEGNTVRISFQSSEECGSIICTLNDVFSKPIVDQLLKNKKEEEKYLEDSPVTTGTRIICFDVTEQEFSARWVPGGDRIPNVTEKHLPLFIETGRLFPIA